MRTRCNATPSPHLHFPLNEPPLLAVAQSPSILSVGLQHQKGGRGEEERRKEEGHGP